jgi:hypothetical protein
VVCLRHLLGIAAVAVCLVAPASAGAAAPQRPLARAATLAAAYWGAAPCGDAIEILARQSLPQAVAADSDAWVTFETPLGPNDLSAAAGDYTACTIAFARSRWPTRTSMRQDWDLLCMTMIHEYGHLLGHVHDTAFGSVMVPVFTDYTSEPQTCRLQR